MMVAHHRSPTHTEGTDSMPRTSSPASRMAEVADAAEGLIHLINEASRATANHGADSPEAHAAWSRVEDRGAIIHRRSRILAGKSRGG